MSNIYLLSNNKYGQARWAQKVKMNTYEIEKQSKKIPKRERVTKPKTSFEKTAKMDRID